MKTIDVVRPPTQTGRHRLHQMLSPTGRATSRSPPSPSSGRPRRSMCCYPGEPAYLKSPHPVLPVPGDAAAPDAVRSASRARRSGTTRPPPCGSTSARPGGTARSGSTPPPPTRAGVGCSRERSTGTATSRRRCRCGATRRSSPGSTATRGTTRGSSRSRSCPAVLVDPAQRRVREVRPGPAGPLRPAGHLDRHVAAGTA